jgi:hypothetical protein
MGKREDAYFVSASSLVVFHLASFLTFLIVVLAMVLFAFTSMAN